MNSAPQNGASRDMHETPARSASSPVTLFSRACRARAFTLVEMAVVVGIVLILAALLLPVAKNMIARGQSSQCISQLHQIGLIFSMFEGEHGLYPAGSFMTNNTPGISANQGWCQGGTPLDMYCSGTDRNVNISPLTVCPSARKPMQMGSLMKVAPGYIYMYNYNIMAGSGATNLVRLNALNGRSPSSLVMLLDQNVNATLVSSAGSQSEYAPHAASYHSGNTSILWVDGHVSQKNWTNVQDGNFKFTLAQPAQ